LTAADPTEAMRNGAFPTTGPFATTITNPVTGLPFPNNTIPTNQLNSSSLAFLNALAPLPNNPAGGFLNYLNTSPLITNDRTDEIKVDTNFSENIRLMAEYLDDNQPQTTPDQENWSGSPYNTTGVEVLTLAKLAQLQLTAILSPSMVNVTSLAMNNHVPNWYEEGIWQRSQIPGFNEVLPYSGSGSNRLPQINFAEGWPSMGVDYALPSTHISDLEDSLSDDWSWLRGSHFIQAGADLTLGTKRQTDFAASNGTWFFNGQFTSNPIADFLLGDAASLYQQNHPTRPYAKYTIVSPYAQDRWQATHKLTLTVGLRLDYLPEPHAQYDYEDIFVPSLYNPADAPLVNANGSITPTPNYNPLNGIIQNGVNGVPLNFSTGPNYYFGPMFGFAWNIFGNGKTALRGGYGIVNTRVPTGTDCSYFCSNNPPFVNSETLVEPPFPNSTGGHVAPPGAPSLTSMDQNLQAAQVQTYSLSLEHQFPGNWFASIATAGNVIRHDNTYWNINQPLPDPPYDYNPDINSGTVYEYLYAPYLGYGAITTGTSEDNGYWNALELLARHSVGHNVSITAAYTWQHGLTDQRGDTLFENNSSTQDVYHPGAGYGTSNLSQFQIFSLSYIWSLPWYLHAAGWRGFALGGWKYAGITSIDSGFSLDPGLSIAHQGLATLPDRTSAPISGPKTLSEWFNTAAFAAPPAGYFGDAGTGSILGPGLIDFDMSFDKDFYVTESKYFEFRAEFFNIFNHTNFSGVQAAYGASDFGAITSALDPRIAEFSLRFAF
jgi:hypothetical protein